MKDIWKLYNDEQQYEKLMETIKGKTIENADLYYDVLKTRYPKELLQLYLDLLHHLENLYPTELIRKYSLLRAAQLKLANRKSKDSSMNGSTIIPAKSQRCRS